MKSRSSYSKFPGTTVVSIVPFLSSTFAPRVALLSYIAKVFEEAPLVFMIIDLRISFPVGLVGIGIIVVPSVVML